MDKKAYLRVPYPQQIVELHAYWACALVYLLWLYAFANAFGHCSVTDYPACTRHIFRRKTKKKELTDWDSPSATGDTALIF